MKNPVFTGAGVAIITPMYEDGSINFDELGRIIEDQIAHHTDAIIICGTTGECSTMTDEEQLAAIKYTVDNCCKAFFDGDTAKARELQLEMLPLADALFCEVNPIPVKYAMNVLGWEAGECRLPLVEPSEAHKEYIEKALRAEGLITE